MKKAILFLFLAFVAMLIILQWRSHSDDGYFKELQMHREERHTFFRTSEVSPFVQKGVEYQPVNYFPPDSKFKVGAKLERFTKREMVSITNSDGSSTHYLKFAYAKFELLNKKHRLLILKTPGFGNKYLMAFADKTSGDTTYGGGRYLDLNIEKSNLIEVDFNKAYNPYCAYVEEFMCPLPPRENLLNIAIEAGEKSYYE